MSVLVALCAVCPGVLVESIYNTFAAIENGRGDERRDVTVNLSLSGAFQGGKAVSFPENKKRDLRLFP